jgi:hypothetical protein
VVVVVVVVVERINGKGCCIWSSRSWSSIIGAKETEEG